MSFFNRQRLCDSVSAYLFPHRMTSILYFNEEGF